MSNLRGKRILILGGNSFVGINLINYLKKIGVKNISSTIFKKKLKKKFKNVKYYKGDLKNYNFCKKITKKNDIVIMCAAETSGAKVIEKSPLDHLTPNVIMNANTLKACYEKKGFMYVFLSSNTVYPVSKKSMQEKNTNYNFFEKYFIVGWMKLFTEKMCYMYSNKIKKKLKTVVIRPGNLFGPYDKFEKDKAKVIPSLIRRAVENQSPFTVWGDGKDIKDFIYIDDFIDGLIKVIKNEKKIYSVYNIAGGNSYKIRDIIKIIFNHLRINPKIIYDKSQPSMIPIRKINIRKMKESYNWRPKIKFEDGIKKTINWYLNRA